MKNSIILSFFSILMFLSCQKQENIRDEFGEAMSKAQYSCSNGSIDSIFFQGSLGNKSFCMISSAENPAARASTGVTMLADKSIAVYFYTTRGDVSYVPIIMLEGPSRLEAKSEVEICDEQLKKGASFPIESSTDKTKSKFSVTLQVRGEGFNVPGTGTSYSLHNATSVSGKQAESAKVIFDDVERIESNSTVTYNVKGRLSCTLYRAGLKDGNMPIFENLNDVKFKFSIDAKK
jgi:hypothetical protein